MAPKKSNTEKANDIFVDATVLAFAGYAGFWGAKLFLTSFYFGVTLAKDILKTILD